MSTSSAFAAAMASYLGVDLIVNYGILGSKWRDLIARIENRPPPSEDQLTQKHVKSIGIKQGLKLFVVAMVIYFFMVYGISTFVIEGAYAGSDERRILNPKLYYYAAMYGLSIYLTFNMTNLLLFDKYSWSRGLIDTAIGVGSTVLATLVYRVAA